MAQIGSYAEEGGVVTADELDLTALQVAIDAGGHTWIAGHTSESNRPIDERLGRFGYNPSGTQEMAIHEREAWSRAYGARSDSRAQPADLAVQGSSTYDWRSPSGTPYLNYISPVKNQGTCGSCCAFGVCAAAGAHAATINYWGPDKNHWDLSESQLWFCIAAEHGLTCAGQGWYVTATLDAFNSMGGITLESIYPYPPSPQPERLPCSLPDGWQNTRVELNGYTTITQDPQLAKVMLATKGPLVTAFSVYEDFYQYYRGGIYTYVQGALVSPHCVCVIGYDDTRGCWMCKNSWGTDWGEDGFFEIAYGQCGIEAQMWSIDAVVVVPSKP